MRTPDGEWFDKARKPGESGVKAVALSSHQARRIVGERRWPGNPSVDQILSAYVEQACNSLPDGLVKI